MSDRHEAVARAIDPVVNAALDEHFGGSWESPEWAAWVGKIADAAIAAIDALPSEATAKAAYEVEAARYDIDMRWDELSDRERAERRAEVEAMGTTVESDDPPVAVVARAIRTAFTRIGGHQPGETFDQWAARMDRALALSAMAAMRAIPWPNPLADIEPTEDELEATQQRWDKEFEDICKLPNDQLPDDPFRESLRAALTYFIAMRKADAATAVVAAHQTVRSDSSVIDAEPGKNDTYVALGLPKGVTLEPWDDDAEPTEAEVEAVRETYIRALATHGWPDAMRVALIAFLVARKAGQ